jgi:hypothetical protein
MMEKAPRGEEEGAHQCQEISILKSLDRAICSSATNPNPIKVACRSPSLSRGAESRDNRGQRHRHRSNSLPKCEREPPDLNRVTVPIKVASSIDAETVQFILTDRAHAGTPSLLVCFPMRNRSQLLVSRRHVTVPLC